MAKVKADNRQTNGRIDGTKTRALTRSGRAPLGAFFNGKTLSQGTHVSNLKAPSFTVQ